MKLLLDTQILVWLAGGVARQAPSLISAKTAALLQDQANELYFSSVAVWEVAIKYGLGRADFRLNPHVFRRALLENGYIELPITSEHGAAVGNLPLLHRDPFDRIQIAQATVEGITFLSSDDMVARYPGPIRRA